MSEQTRSYSGPLIVGGLLVGGYLLVKKLILPPVKLKRYVTQLRVYMPTVRFKGDDVEFDLYIQNPNSTPLTITAIVGDVWVISNNGTTRLKVGNVAKYGKTVIKPTAETKFPFKVRTKFIQLLAYFNMVLQGRLKGQRVQFTGTVNLNGRTIPISESYTIA